MNEVQCDACEKVAKYPDEMAGKNCKCPRCKSLISLPKKQHHAPHRYRQIRGPLGRRLVAYQCLACGERLRSRFQDAGNTDFCPTCGSLFVVPGSLEFSKYQAERKEQSERVASPMTLKLHYEAEKDLLEHHLNKVADVSEVRAISKSNETIRQLESAYNQLTIDYKVGMNSETEKILLQLSQMVATQIERIESAGIPEDIQQHAISQLLKVRNATASQIVT